MFCFIYRSNKKPDTYLYLAAKNNFSSVPAPLMQLFGTPKLVMTLQLDNVKKLAAVELEQLKTALQEKGFYLQLPRTEDTA